MIKVVVGRVMPIVRLRFSLITRKNTRFVETGQFKLQIIIIQACYVMGRVVRPERPEVIKYIKVNL